MSTEQVNRTEPSVFDNTEIAQINQFRLYNSTPFGDVCMCWGGGGRELKRHVTRLRVTHALDTMRYEGGWLG